MQNDIDNEAIVIKGARVNNLKNIDLRIPRNQLVVVTGLSGSGKSSLAFDTLYAEGQRRYVESLSAYARQFLGRMNKPECDYIKGLPPAIAIEQKVTSRNPRSTVGTSTEIYDYLRLLFARIGRTFSPVSGVEVHRHSVDDVVATALRYGIGTRFTVLARLRERTDRTVEEALDIYVKQGITRLDIDGQMAHIEDVLKDETQLEAVRQGRALLLIDRLEVVDDKPFRARLSDSVQTAFFEGDGECALRFYPARMLEYFSIRFEADGIKFEEPSDQLFSFNSPLGACPVCEGYGKTMGIAEDLVVPDPTKSVYDEAVAMWRGLKMGQWREEFIRRAADRGFPIHTPYADLTDEQRRWLWEGDAIEKALPEEEQVSINACVRDIEAHQYKVQFRVMLSRYKGKTICPACRGRRLRPEALYVQVAGRTIADICESPVSDLAEWFDHIELSEHDTKVAARLLTEIRSRLRFLNEVGLGYLTLSRLSSTLSGGESQRINLATSLGSSLVGSLYILDEPSIGLHSRDTDRLIAVLKQLRDLGNTVIIVEHDEDIIRQADYLIDIGPEAGRLGGEVVFAAPYAEAMKGRKTDAKSHTINYLLGRETIEVPAVRRAWNRSLRLRGVHQNNLRGVDVEFPLNVMTVVTGVSGSGKSTLVTDVLATALQAHLGEVVTSSHNYIALEGDLQAVQHLEYVDQNPIGKSSRSNPVTYVKAYDEIRKLMAEQPLSKQMLFTPAHFSFNTEGGRCEECKGEGVVKVPMQFMADLELTCEACHGQRFRRDVLEVRFEGKNIFDILNLTVDQAIDFFTEHKRKKIVQRLQPLQDVGLGYIKLGQSSSTLSGGENQRVKLAFFLGQDYNRPTLFIFDEPTTGLHFHDISKLLRSLSALIERGHTVIVIEHNMDVIKMADHIIDLGPDGGRAGGQIVATGTPEAIVKAGKGHTAKFLAEKLSL